MCLLYKLSFKTQSELSGTHLFFLDKQLTLHFLQIGIVVLPQDTGVSHIDLVASFQSSVLLLKRSIKKSGTHDPTRWVPSRGNPEDGGNIEESPDLGWRSDEASPEKPCSRCPTDMC